MKYTKKYTWEYNLMQSVRWDTEDAKDDVCFFVKTFLKEIIESEQLTLDNVEDSCDICKFTDECRFKNEEEDEICKYYIKV